MSELSLSRTNSCLRRGVTSMFWLMNILTGLFKLILTKSSTLSVIVAEKSIVCLVLEHRRITSLSCSAKYSSSMRSASSKIKISTVSKLKHGVLCKWSMRRPGVAIQISGPSLSAASWAFTSKPPFEEEVFKIFDLIKFKKKKSNLKLTCA